MYRKAGIVGCGVLGVTMAGLVEESGAETVMWADSAELAEKIGKERRSPNLGWYELPEGVKVTDSMEDLGDCDLVIVTTTSKYVRLVSEELGKCALEGAVVMSASKGIEEGTGKRMSEVILEGTGGGVRVAVMSGPNFAEEIAKKLPAASVVACEDIEVARGLQRFLSRPYFRVYSTDDVVGVELGGPAKNVIAIAAGMCAGLGLGHNARAALITRGLAEIMRLGVALGARPITFSGLAGIGDLMLTATSTKSRNYRAGLRLAEGRSLEEVLEELVTVEGVFSCKAMLGLAKAASVEMPISEEVERVLFEGKSPADAVKSLMGRELKAEMMEFVEGDEGRAV